MRKIVIKKGEEKIHIPLGIFVNGFIIRVKNMVQYNQVNNQKPIASKKGE